MNIDTRLQRLVERRGMTQEEGTEWFDELMAKKRLQEISAPVGRLQYVLERMAKTIFPEAPLNVQVYGRNICHGFVSLKAKERMNLGDKIWIYGVNSPEQVWHSVLTDAHNEVVMDTFKSKGHFLEHKGYILTDGGEDTELLDLMQCIPVGDLHSKFLSGVMASTVPTLQQLVNTVKTGLERHGFAFGGKEHKPNGDYSMTTENDVEFPVMREYMKDLGYEVDYRNRSGGATFYRDFGNQRAKVEYVPPVRVSISIGPVAEVAFGVGGQHNPMLEINLGNVLRKKKSYPIQKTKDPRVDYMTVVNKGHTTWFFYLDGQCGAYTEMEVAYDSLSKTLMQWWKTKKVLTPHSSATTLKGLGYPSFVYQLALKKGFLLATMEHTPDAAKLWESIARRANARILYVNPNNRSITTKPRKGESVIKVMVPSTFKIKEA